MRKFYLVFHLLSVLFIGKSFSQQQLSPDNLGKKYVKLKDWKFHAGDNPDWASPALDDSDWQPINPTLPLYQLHEVKEAGIGWFRIKLKLDSSLLNERLAFVITSMGASEIYLNGKLIYNFGSPSSVYETEATRIVNFRPYSVKLGSGEIQQLAVRYSFLRNNFNLNVSTNICFQILVKEHNQAFKDYLRHEGRYRTLRLIQLFFYLPLAFFLLFFYFSYRLRKEYFYIGLFSFSMFLGMLCQIVASMEGKTANTANWLLAIQNALLIAGLIFFLIGNYAIFDQRKKWFYRTCLSVGILLMAAIFLANKDLNVPAAIYSTVVICDYLRVTIKGYSQGRRGSLILLITAITCFVLAGFEFAFKLVGENELGYFIYSLNFIIPHIGLSLFFAGEFARTGISLQSRLAEVQQLSEKTILQEKEKQQLLASQNVILEQQVKDRTAELMQERQALEAEKEAKLLADFNRKFSESELKALRSQMNPHFVFNILNTIESYALENNKEAVSDMIQKFSKLTRLVLENSMNQLVPFDNDWRSLQLYIDLEQMRYAGTFSVVYDVEEQIHQQEYFIPPMIIQPFVENAIIHGLRNRAGNNGILKLSARMQNGYIIIEVEDNGIGRTKTAQLRLNNPIQKNSLGIKVTQDRISIFNNLNQYKKAKVEIQDLKEGTRVMIFLPTADPA